MAFGKPILNLHEKYVRGVNKFWKRRKMTELPYQLKSNLKHDALAPKMTNASIK